MKRAPAAAREPKSDYTDPSMGADQARWTRVSGVTEAAREKIRGRFPAFLEIWIVDFEFCAPDGCNPDVVCMVAREFLSGQEYRLWQDKLRLLKAAPWDVGPSSATVAYYASAEMNCFRALGWAPPENIIDLYCEFRAETNGLPLPAGSGLIGALAYFGLSGMSDGEKQMMRDLIMSGGPWSDKERASILDYCAEDVFATESLFSVMSDMISTSHCRIGHMVLRGRYMNAVAAMETNGIPVDVSTFNALKENWSSIQDKLIEAVDCDYGVYDGSTFKSDLFLRWLSARSIPWPRLDTGALSLGDDTFRQMAKSYPEVSALRELRHALGELRLNSIPVGPDGRSRALISPLRSRTGRNQPSTSRFLFGSATWLRGLIKPTEGRAIAYLDFSSQEIAIAAGLSNDSALWRAYMSGDPYMQFARDAGLAPPDATKSTHKAVRARCKAIVLGVQYGMGAESMAANAGMSVIEARQLLVLHKETYRTFWSWAEINVARALLGGELTTPFGWRYRIHPHEMANPRSLLNWPMQAGGSDMLRLACTDIVRNGVKLCAPVHDAVLIEAPVEIIDEHVEITRDAMMRASSFVLDGPTCRVDDEIFRFPERFMDVERGATMWNKVMGLIDCPLWTPKQENLGGVR
jgi:DNA polymerase-1